MQKIPKKPVKRAAKTTKPRAKKTALPASALPQWKQRERERAEAIAARGETELAAFYGAHLLSPNELNTLNELARSGARFDLDSPRNAEALPERERAKPRASEAHMTEPAGIRGYKARAFPARAIRLGKASAMIGEARVVHFPQGATAREAKALLARESRHDKAAKERGATTKRAAKVKPWTPEKITKWTKARKARALDLLAAKKAARVAGKASFVTARFHTNGSAKRDEVTREIVEIRDGTGRPIESQGMEEMRAEARAAYLASLEASETRDGFKCAANAAQKTLRRALREPAYASVETATRAHDRNYRRARDSWNGNECEPNDKQPHSAEFMVTDSGETFLPPRAVMARQLRKAKAALRAHYARRDYPRARADMRRDLATVRALAREIASGEFSPLKWAEDTARAQRFNDLAKRAQSGFATLAIVPRITITGLPAREPQASPQRFTLFPLRGEARDVLSVPASRKALGNARATREQIATLGDCFAMA